MSIATKDPVFSEFLVDQLDDIQNYGIESVTAYESGAKTYLWGNVLTKSGAKWRQLVAADVAVRVTPVAVGSAIYELQITTEQVAKTVAFTAGSGSPTVQSIVDGLVSAINADSDIAPYVTAVNTSNVLVITEDVPCKLTVRATSSAATGLYTIVGLPSELAVVVGDKSGVGRGYSTSVSATTDTKFHVLLKGPASFKVGKLTYGDTLTSAKQASVQAILKNQGIKLVSVASTIGTNLYA